MGDDPLEVLGQIVWIFRGYRWYIHSYI